MGMSSKRILAGKCPVDHEAMRASASNNAEASSSTSPGTNGASHANGGPAMNGMPGGTSLDIEALRAAGIKFDFAAMAAGKCPVDPSEIAAMQAEAARTGKCPLDEKTLEMIKSMQHMQSTPPTTDSNGQAPVAENGEAAKVVCPFGFGSVDAEGNSSNRTSLHCSKCKALYFDAVKTNCGHVFCRSCIEPSPACLKCGASVETLTSDTFIQGLVDMFITEHTTDKFLQQHKPEDESDKSDKHVEFLKAEFHLQIGLQSFRGGNFKAASQRLEVCKSTLLNSPVQLQEQPEVRTLMGSACGCQGDCSIQSGDMQEAVDFYNVSAQYLDSPSREVQQALSVTQNKLGDLWYRVGHLELASENYKKALNVRRRLCDTSPEDVVAQIDYALSLAKVADIEQACQEHEEARKRSEEAKTLTARLLQEPSVQGNRRLESLAAYLSVSIEG